MIYQFSDIESSIVKVGVYVKDRLACFRQLGRDGETYFDFRPFAYLWFRTCVFLEFVFCILTAGSSALLGLKIQSVMDKDFLESADKDEIAQFLKSNGYRFYNNRAEYIVEMRKRFDGVMDIVLSGLDYMEKRERLVSFVKGFGYKEASHFLRNIGYKDLAIVDRHVFRYLVDKGLVSNRKTITKNVYFECENALLGICEALNISQAELDLYIFYNKTGKVLK